MSWQTVILFICFPVIEAFPLFTARADNSTDMSNSTSATASTSSVSSSSIANLLQSQWTSPHDLLTILMIVGGDIIQKALAQMAGAGYFVPVTFSFGWVSYAFGALLGAVGDNRIMPTTDCQSVVVNAESGYVRDNQSWVLGRLLRDVEEPCERGLRVAVFEAKQ